LIRPTRRASYIADLVLVLSGRTYITRLRGGVVEQQKQRARGAQNKSRSEVHAECGPNFYTEMPNLHFVRTIPFVCVCLK
jgi:hypothetical protein